ncbi:MAG: hypothetical protein ACJ790_15545 [Myxococcaceae bacterium]
MSEPANPKPPPRTPTNPDAFKAVSAARMAGIKQAERPRSFGEKVKSVFADITLNAWASLKQLGKDFKNSDRFFKYKAGVVALWLVLSVTGFMVATSATSLSAKNSLDCKLTVAEVVGEPVYSLKNVGTDPWTDIIVIANGTYRLASAKVDPNDTLTFEVKRLTGPNGKPAPKDMKITDLTLKTNEGKSTLIKEGEPVE